MHTAFLTIAAAIGAATLALPASAQTRTMAVSYADLDLSTAEGMDELEQRLDRAAWRVCKLDRQGTLHARVDQLRCYRQTRKTNAVQLAQVASRVQLGG